MKRRSFLLSVRDLHVADEYTPDHEWNRPEVPFQKSDSRSVRYGLWVLNGKEHRIWAIPYYNVRHKSREFIGHSQG